MLITLFITRFLSFPPKKTTRFLARANAREETIRMLKSINFVKSLQNLM